MKLFSIFVFTVFISLQGFGWGSRGHKMVAAIARKCLSQNIIDSVEKYLGKTSFKDAAVWMDEVRSDGDYDYLKPWHYVNVEKGNEYKKTAEPDVVNEIQMTFEKLKTKFAGEKDRKYKMNFYLKVLFHLVGDIHQPLHCGYAEDKGANLIDVSYLGKASNLHQVWDTDLIEEEGIKLKDCLARANSIAQDEKNKWLTADPVVWMEECRSYLPQVYDFDKKINQDYINKNRALVETQLAKAGVRLAYMLHLVFGGGK